MVSSKKKEGTGKKTENADVKVELEGEGKGG